jgi:hypothetical protein
MATPSAVLSEITASTELDDVFLHFLVRFEALPVPRSVAEIRVTTDEFEALKLWFSEGWGKPRMWCEDTFQIDFSNQVSASRQEILKADKVSYPALFVAGQPTTACKKAMAAGARRLSLRNLIDRYGAQEYFDTLKLQFGFTLRGSVRRLPEWLDGLGPPMAVRILTGAEPEYEDLSSNSFAGLWEALRHFRRDGVSREVTSAVLERSRGFAPNGHLT